MTINKPWNEMTIEELNESLKEASLIWHKLNLETESAKILVLTILDEKNRRLMALSTEVDDFIKANS